MNEQFLPLTELIDEYAATAPKDASGVPDLYAPSDLILAMQMCRTKIERPTHEVPTRLDQLLDLIETLQRFHGTAEEHQYPPLKRWLELFAPYEFLEIPDQRMVLPLNRHYHPLGFRGARHVDYHLCTDYMIPAAHFLQTGNLYAGSYQPWDGTLGMSKYLAVLLSVISPLADGRAPLWKDPNYTCSPAGHAAGVPHPLWPHGRIN